MQHEENFWKLREITDAEKKRTHQKLERPFKEPSSLISLNLVGKSRIKLGVRRTLFNASAYIHEWVWSDSESSFSLADLLPTFVNNHRKVGREKSPEFAADRWTLAPNAAADVDTLICDKAHTQTEARSHARARIPIHTHIHSFYLNC